jgi:hypothetical protein
MVAKEEFFDIRIFAVMMTAKERKKMRRSYYRYYYCGSRDSVP